MLLLMRGAILRACAFCCILVYSELFLELEKPLRCSRGLYDDIVLYKQIIATGSRTESGKRSETYPIVPSGLGQRTADIVLYAAQSLECLQKSDMYGRLRSQFSHYLIYVLQFRQCGLTVVCLPRGRYCSVCKL